MPELTVIHVPFPSRHMQNAMNLMRINDFHRNIKEVRLWSNINFVVLLITSPSSIKYTHLCVRRLEQQVVVLINMLKNGTKAWGSL